MTLMRLPFPLLLALRYLRSTRKDAFVTFLSAVAGGGIAVGVAALILALAALSGFQRVLIADVLARSPQIEVELARGSDVEAARRAALAVEGVAEARTLVRGAGWILARGGRVQPQPVEIVGFEVGLPASFGEAAGRPEGVYLGTRLARRWGIEPGERIEIVSPRPTLTPFGGPQPRVRSAVVSGLYESSALPDEEERVAVPLELGASLLDPVERRLEIDAGGFGAAPAVAERLEAALPESARVADWRDLNGPLFFVLKLEKALMFVAVSLIVLVAVLALVADLSLIVANKRAEIGMLGAMGATPAALSRAFLWLGGCLATAGALAGVLIGGSAAYLLDRYRVIPVPRGVYFLDHIPFLVRPADLGAVVAVTLALALASAFWAARRAAALSPLAALQR